MEVPQNIAYERRVLGFALRNTDAREEVISKLRPADFYDSDNAVVFEVLSEKARAGKFLDSELLVHELGILPAADRPKNDPLELAMSLMDASTTMTAPAVSEYVTILRNLGKARDLMQSGTRLFTAGSTSDGTTESLDTALHQADEEVRAVIDRNVDASWTPLAEIVDDFDGNPNLQPLFSSGLVDLDNLLQGGFRAGQFVTVAARPAMGKTTLATVIAQYASIRKGVPGLIISLEMNNDEIGMRILSGQGAVPLESIQRNEMSDEDHDAIESVQERLRSSKPPLYVVDDIMPSFPAIRAEIIAAQRRVGIKYAVIDYLQLISDDGTSNPSRENVMANISRQVKSLARQLGITIFVISQLNRKPEERTNHRPMISDLRESGQIEQDSDIILLLYRPEVYSPEDRPGEADLIVGKHRNGRTGDVPLLFKGHFSTFSSMAREETYAPSA